MRFKRMMVFPILLSLVCSLSAQWPEDLERYEKGMCLVEFFLPQFETGEIKDDSRIKWTTTGILVREDGLVITSDVIFPANLDILGRGGFFSSAQSPPENITVTFEKDKKQKAVFIGKDEELRLAFIQIEKPEELPQAIHFTSGNAYRVGEPLFLLQHLNGRFDNEVFYSENHINAVIAKPDQKLIVSSSITPLSAGGLVIDKMGNATGLVFRGDGIISPNMEMERRGGGMNLTQILPAARYQGLIKNPPRLTIQKQGGGKSWLGIQMQILKGEMAAYWDLGNTHGILVNSVVQRSPAEEAGIKVGDLITGLEKLTVQSEDESELDIFRNYIRSLPEGEIKVHLVRGKKPITVTVKLRSAPKSQFLAEEVTEERLRFSVKELTQDIRLAFDLDFDTEGVLVSRVEDAGSAGLGGLEINDLILRIDDTAVKDLDDFREWSLQGTDSVTGFIQIFVQRAKKTHFLYVKSDQNRG